MNHHTPHAPRVLQQAAVRLPHSKQPARLRAAARTRRPALRSLRLAAYLACSVLGAALQTAWAAPVVIQNQFLRVGINEIGTLGANGAAGPGILYDHTGSGNFNHPDLLLPHTPVEGFVMTKDIVGPCNIPYPLFGSAAEACQFSLTSTPSGSSFVSPTAPALLSPTSATWSAVALDGEMAVTHQYDLFSVGALQVIGVTTTITALQPIPQELYFLRYMDADPDGALSAPFYATHNGPFSDHLACSTSAASTLTACINTSSPFQHRTAVFDATSLPLDPFNFLQGPQPWNYGYGDNGLGMAFNLGTFAAGQSKSFNYEYFIGGTPLDTQVPEPGSIGLAGLALVALAWVRRQRPGGAAPAQALLKL